MPRNPNKTDYSLGFPVGFESFASIPDPRDGGNTRHRFGEILFMAFAALLCGVRSYELMEEFCELKGAVVTIDAMGTQRAIAAAIKEKEGDYVLCDKGNPGRLHDEMRDQFDFAPRQLGATKLDPARWSVVARTEGTGHDRVETRSIVVCHDLGWMDAEIRAEWKDIRSVVMVHRHTLPGAGKTRSETSYYISSLGDTRAEVMLAYLRGDWSIENR